MWNRLNGNYDRLFWSAHLRPEHAIHLIIAVRIDDGRGEAERDGGTIAVTVDRRDKYHSQPSPTIVDG